MNNYFIEFTRGGFKDILKLFLVIGLCIAGSTQVIAVRGAEVNIGDGTQGPGKTVTGKVSDSSGAPLIGVTIVIEGTTQGVITDFDGNYTIEVPSDQSILDFSFVGYMTEKVPVAGKTEINIVLTEDVMEMGEVVVTALGIKREKKTLTYSSQEVSGDEMMKSKDINFMSNLSGKTAGLEIRKSTSGAGGSTRTVLRGSKSVNTVGDPLYVIDGVPMVNNKGNQSGVWGGTDDGDGLSQINPDDIESISVLKGATASILYGSDGANGVVIITTKQGKEGKTIVSFSSSTTFENVSMIPDLQFKYGANGNSAESWSTTPSNDYEDGYVKDFFRTGYNLVNNVSISSGNEKMSTYFSYGNTSAGGVIPNNHYNKHNFTFKQVAKLWDDKVTLTSNVMLVNEKTKNRSTAGYYLNPLTGLYFFPRDGAVPVSGNYSTKQPFSYYKSNYQYFMTDRNMYWQEWGVESDLQSNPYWLLNKQPKEDVTNRVIASVSAEYKITPKLIFKVRANYDYANKSFETKYYAGGNTVNISENGRWDYRKYVDKQGYTDGIFTYQNDFGDLNLGVIAGASYQESIFGDGVSVDNGTNDLLYPNEFYFQNLPDNVQVESTYQGRIIKEGVFANIQLGYKNYLFLDLSGRNDWSSTLALTGNESYFYPAVGISAILSQAFVLPDYITFAKVRASGSQVNNEVPWGLIEVDNTINSSEGVDRNTVEPFTDAKPEEIVTYEVGANVRFLNGRVGFDFTYYDITSTNQALSKDLSANEQYGNYTSKYFNAGKITNKGVEIVLDGTPVKNSNLEWKTSLNFSTNKNKIVSLFPDDPDNYIDLGSSDGYVSRATTGGSIGDIYVYKFTKNEAGQILVDVEDGTISKSTDVEYAGSIDPDFSLGWNNTINYKNWSLNFLINAKVGGKAYSQTESMLDGYGVSQRTADARDKGYVTINGIDGTTAVTQMDPEDYYSAVGGRNGISEAYLYDRTNIRLASVSLNYTFDVQQLGLPVQSASFSLVGQNLFFFYKDAPFDPELSMSTDLSSQSLDCFNVPATRTYGFNLKFTF